MTQALSKAETGAELDAFAGTNPAQVARAFKASGMFPDLKDEAQAFVKVIAGRELGIGPMASMMGINMIQGKVTLSANLMASQVKASATYDYIVREHTAQTCRMDFLQNGEVIGTSEFTIEDAQRAGLVRGQNWQKYPKAMLFARALSQGVRWYCPDVLNGSPAYVPEEMGAMVNSEGEATNVTNPEPDPPVEAEVVEGEVVESLDPERVKRICAGFKALNLNIGEVANLFGAAGLDGLRARSKKAIEERLTALTEDEADALEAEMARQADNG
jgi:hypothetical protein